MKRKERLKIFKIIIAILVILLIVGIIAYLFPVMRNLSTPEGQADFKAKVDESGIIGLLMLFGLQVAQIFLFIVPGEPIEILAGMCYGWFLGYDIHLNFCIYYINFNFFISKKIWKKICI